LQKRSREQYQSNKKRGKNYRKFLPLYFGNGLPFTIAQVFEAVPGVVPVLVPVLVPVVQRVLVPVVQRVLGLRPVVPQLFPHLPLLLALLSASVCKQ